MADMIKLTITDGKVKGDPIYFQVCHIVEVHRHPDEQATIIGVIGGSFFWVAETVEEVVSDIERTKNV